MKEYFSHDYNARNDKKIIRLFMKHGVSGIGIYWCIIEMLFEESGYLNIDEYERISFELRTDNETIKSVIEDFELFKEDGIKFWSDSAIQRLTERMNKSSKARSSVMKRWNKVKSDTNVLQTNNDGNTSKVKESKVKEINIDFDIFWNLYNKKVSKVKCEPKWNRLKDNERQTIIDTLPLFLSNIKDKQFQPNPETYLNQRRWEDELTPSKPKPIDDGKERKQYMYLGDHKWYSHTEEESTAFMSKFHTSIRNTKK